MNSGCTRALLGGAVLALLPILAREAGAATFDTWTNNDSGAWSVASNWSSNAPNSTFNSILITNAASKVVTIDAATPSTNLTIQRLTLSAPTGFTNTLALVNLSTNAPLQLSSTLTVDRGGVLTLTNSAVNSAGATVDRGGAINLTNSVVSETGFTTFDVVNGTVWLDSGQINCGAIQAVRLGRTNNGTGRLTLGGGTMLASEMQIAASTSSQGILTVGGGTVNAASTVTAGYGVNSTGTVSVTAGGQLIATNEVTYVGKSGFGQATISGGSATFAFMSVGNNANGVLSVTGGQLNVKPRTTNDWMQIGYVGAGQFNLSSGSVALLSEFHIGDDSSGLGTGSGTASITGGQLIATNDLTAIGRYGPGQMTVSNALVMLTNVSVGRHDGSVGTLTVQSNAQVLLLDALSIGRFSNSVGHVFVTGGLLSLTNDVVWVGREGAGDMTVSGGTVRAMGALVAVSTVITDPNTGLPVTNVPSGSLTVSGGSLVLSSNFVVGSSSISTGYVSVAGGNLTVANGANTAYLSVQQGGFTFGPGTLSVDNLLLTNAGGTFTFNSGTLQARNITAANGSPFVIGDGVNPATLQLRGGTYSFANGLVISANATVTGCGTIIGAVTNNGTIAFNCVTITGITKTGTTATISFTTLTGSNHVMEYKDALGVPAWTAILPGVIGNGGVLTKTDTNAVVASRFYRVHIQ